MEFFAHQFMSLLEPREKQRDILPLEAATDQLLGVNIKKYSLKQNIN